MLTEDERQQFVVNFLAELEAEHDRRESAASVPRKRRGTRRTDAFKRQEEEATLKNELRHRFYQDHGYRQATDRTGRQVWLSPAEYEIRDRSRHRVRKKKRKTARYKPRLPSRARDIGLFLMMCISAVLIGLMLVR